VFRKVLIAACALMLAGCTTITTKYPIGTTTGLGADKAILGSWSGTLRDSQTRVIAHFIAAQEAGIAAILITREGGNNENTGAGVFMLRTATLGGNHFANAYKQLNGDDFQSLKFDDMHMPVLYRVGSDGTLSLSLLNEQKTKDAIAAGKLTGTIGSGTIDITSEPQVLDAFMATPEGAGLFNVLVVLKRMD
jgi:hypothetical protein